MLYHPFYTSPGVTYDMYGEQLMRNYWYYLVKASPGNVSVGSALMLSKRNFDYGWYVSDDEEKMCMAVTLYGLPWVGIYGQIGGSMASQAPEPLGPYDMVSPLGPPEATLAGTYAVTYTLDATNHWIADVDGFDVVQVEAMGLTYGDEAPIVPLAMIELPLPLGASVEEISVLREGETSLGALNIPMYAARLPVPGGEPGGYSPTPGDFGLFPSQPYTVTVTDAGTNQLVRVYAIPLEYDPATGQTTLYQQLTVRVTYNLEADVALLDLTATPTDAAPEAPFAVQATLFNASSDPLPVTGTLTLEDEWGGVAATEPILPFDLPPGEEFPWETAWMAPGGEGGYRLVLELWHAGERQVYGWQALNVVGGRITALEVPAGVRPGQPAPFWVSFANRRGEPFEGDVLLSIHDATGAQLATLEAPLSVPALGEETLELVWDTGGMGPGAYTASARVVAQGEAATYGPSTHPFRLNNLAYLPLVLRTD
jgi:hypothetical protein